LYFIGGGTLNSAMSSLIMVPVETDRTFHAGNPRPLLNGHYFAGLVGRTYDLSPDGQRFLMVKTTGHSLTTADDIVVVENWSEELKQRVPTR
jgi:hypothetical protein